MSGTFEQARAWDWRNSHNSLDGRVVLLELDQLVVTTSNGSFIGALCDEYDEEISDVFPAHGLFVCLLLGRGPVWGDEAEVASQAIRDGQDPDESPQSGEGRTLVCPFPGGVEVDPDGGHTGDEEEVEEPRPLLPPEESVAAHGLLVLREVRRPSRRVQLGEHLGVSRLRDSRAGGGRAPVHDGPGELAETMVLGYSPIARAPVPVTGTMHDGLSKPPGKLKGYATGSLGLGHKEAVPDPLAELEASSVEHVVGNPSHEKVE